MLVCLFFFCLLPSAFCLLRLHALSLWLLTPDQEVVGWHLESTLCGLNRNSLSGRVYGSVNAAGLGLQYNPIRSDFDPIFRSFPFSNFYFIFRL